MRLQVVACFCCLYAICLVTIQAKISKDIIEAVINDGSCYGEYEPKWSKQTRSVDAVFYYDDYVYPDYPVPVEQIYGLFALFEATNGEFWNWRNESYGAIWNFNTNFSSINPCNSSWQGITSCKCGNNECSIEAIELRGYNLVGEIPDLRNLSTYLLILDLSSNSIKGDLSGLGLLRNLEHLDLSKNQITDTLVHLSNLSSLNDLRIGFNNFHGTLDGVSSLVNLTSFTLNDNQLTGTLDAISSLTNLKDFYAWDNFLSGNLDVIGQLPSIEHVELNDNDFDGALDGLIYSRSSRLTTLYAMNNRIRGSLAGLGSLTSMQNLTLGNNKLTGPIHYIANLTKLVVLGLGNNSLTGGLDALRDMKLLHATNLENNIFNGTLDMLSNLSSIKYFHAPLNYLRGPLPSLMNLTLLTYVNVENNYLSGPIGSIFSHSMEFIDLNNNLFNGKIPMDIFTANLKIFAASLNCLTVSFTDDICGATSLQTLLLDGVNNAPSCRVKSRFFLTALHNVFYHDPGTIYQVSKAATRIPSCLYSLPKLVKLHLAGNGMTGKLPQSVNVTNSLQELVLGSNSMTGEIPSAFQHHRWSKIDLSYNKFTGTLSEALSVTDDIKLNVNRLSGPIPTSLYTTKSVAILEGNIFYCKLFSNTLKDLNDEVGEDYICGTNSTYVIGFFWLLALAIAAIDCCCSNNGIVSFCKELLPPRIKELAQDKLKKSKGKLSEVEELSQLFRDILRCTVWLVACLLGVVIIFSVLHHYYSTYTWEYLWFLSVAYLSGEVPGIVLFVVYMLTSSIFVLRIYESVKIPFGLDGKTNMQNEYAKRNWSEPVLYIPYLFIKVLLLIILGLVDIVIMSIVNGWFVYATLNKGAVYYYCVLFIKLVVGVISEPLLVLALGSMDKHWFPSLKKWCMGDNKKAEGHLVFLTLMSLWNNYLVPFIATAIEDPNCFYNAVVDARPAVETSVYAEVQITNSKSVLISSNLEYVPGYSYSYQCSSAILSAYVPFYIFYTLIMTLWNCVRLFYLSYKQSVHAWLEFICCCCCRCCCRCCCCCCCYLRLFYLRLYSRLNGCCRRCNDTSSDSLKESLTPRDESSDHDCCATSKKSKKGPNPMYSWFLKCYFSCCIDGTEYDMIVQEGMFKNGRVYKAVSNTDETSNMVKAVVGDGGDVSFVGAVTRDIMRSHQFYRKKIKPFTYQAFVLKIMEFVSIMMTFGTLAPLLSFCCLICTVSFLIWYQYTVYHHLSHESDEADDGEELLIDKAVKDVRDALIKSVLVVLLATGVFYACVIFDIIGNEEGWHRAFLFFIIVIVASSIAYNFPYIHRFWINLNCKNIQCTCERAVCPQSSLGSNRDSTSEMSNRSNKSSV